MSNNTLLGSTPRPNLAEPYYLVLFKSSAGNVPNRPVIASGTHAAENVTLPYGLDRELAVALPAMWYCLHLPRTRLDYIDRAATGLKASQKLNLPHHILLLPVPWPNPLPRFYPVDWPAIILAPETLRSEAEQIASLLPHVVEIADTGALGPASLQRHWSVLYATLRLDRPRYIWPTRIFSESSQRALLLPNAFLTRQFSGGRDDETLDTERPTKADFLEYAAQCQVVLSATAKLEREGIAPPEAETRFPQTIAQEWQSYQCPVALLLPGTSPNTASRKIARQLAKRGLGVSLDANMENAALEFLVAHRAAARFGVAVHGADLPDSAFNTLATLEQMFDGSTVAPRKVKNCLGRLTHEVLAGLTDEEQFLLLHASSITSFSEFPIGLVTIPPATSPLCCQTPIAYRPLVPLTRALQLETYAVPMTYLRDKLAVLCLECIPSEQRVGRLSRRGWEEASKELRGYKNVTFDFIEVDSISRLREGLHAKEYDVAVISAHGIYDREMNRTGFQVGSREVVFGEELGRVPPLVCLAACQVAPRGAGSMNITDLLFRQGAVAVLGTLVPIDVRRNAHLMLRFFIYIAETLDGSNPSRSLDEVWQFTTTTNAVLDVTLGARHAADWMWEKRNGRHGIEEFMLSRSVSDRLRRSHIYADTEVIMQTMANERGKGASFKAWLTNQGYVPESIFYVFLGWPERFVVCDKEFEEARRMYGAA